MKYATSASCNLSELTNKLLTAQMHFTFALAGRLTTRIGVAASISSSSPSRSSVMAAYLASSVAESPESERIKDDLLRLYRGKKTGYELVTGS